ncbi:MAG TPA: polysaccharide biosynthesis/export family protein [Verrucomicrobiae bacterium]|nr:polysaccharide biosynthesis/export family protein [Verrucomicrobiae bacterium]
MSASKLAGGWRAVCGLVFGVLLLAGCKSGAGDPRFADMPGGPAGSSAIASPAIAAPAPVTGAAMDPGSMDQTNVLDVLHPNDAVIITFSDLPVPQPPISDRVKEDGTITLIQNQTFQAAGKTRRDLEKEIRARYVPDYFKTMTVQVEHAEQSRFYYVGGEVKLPARQIYISRITVLKAIQSAGDFTDFARKRGVVLTRANGKTVTVNCVRAQRHPELDLEIFPGDKIWVPRRNPFW